MNRNNMLAPRYANAPSVQGKIIRVENDFGNFIIDQQQGTTRTIYDALPLDGRTTFRFFQNVGNRTFPFTNLNRNQLEINEAMAIQYLTLSVMTVVGGEVTSLKGLSRAGFDVLYRSDLNVIIANSQVLKQVSLTNTMPELNKNSQWGALNAEVGAMVGNEIYEFFTWCIIPQLREFEFNLQTGFGAVEANSYLLLTLEGTGAIEAPKRPM